MKSFIKFFFIIIILSAGTGFTSSAQDSSIIKVPPFKPPVVKSYLGINASGASVTVDEASELIALPLKITDDKKNVYTVDSYGFLYKKKGVIEDEQTGLKKTTFTNVADRFKTTPLPKIWVDNLKNGFQKDEELYFFDILVKDNKNRKFYAPDLRITVK